MVYIVILAMVALFLGLRLYAVLGKRTGHEPVLRNPADGHKIKVFDPAIRRHTDQFAYKFRKPAN